MGKRRKVQYKNGEDETWERPTRSAAQGRRGGSRSNHAKRQRVKIRAGGFRKAILGGTRDPQPKRDNFLTGKWTYSQGPQLARPRAWRRKKKGGSQKELLG